MLALVKRKLFCGKNHLLIYTTSPIVVKKDSLGRSGGSWVVLEDSRLNVNTKVAIYGSSLGRNAFSMFEMQILYIVQYLQLQL